MTVLCVGLFGAGVYSADAQTMLIDGRNVEDLVESDEADRNMSFRVVDVEGQPFSQAVEARVPRRVDPEWHAQVVSRYSSRAVRRGDVLRGSYYIRGRGDGDRPAVVRAAFSKLVGGYERLHELYVEVPTQWERREFEVVAIKDYPAGSLLVGFHLGGQAQTVQLANLQVVIETAEPQ